MANGINKVILVGNLGSDPEIQNFDNDVKKASFSIATTESYKARSGEQVSNTEWHRIVLWRGLAGIAERFLKKGSKVYLEGKLRTRQYQDQEGKTRYITEIEGREMVMLDRKEQTGEFGSSPQAPQTSQTPQQTPQSPQASPLGNQADDLPF